MILLLLKNWKLALGGVLILAALSYVGILKLQLGVAHRTVEKQATQIAELTASTALQNQMVEGWKQAALKQDELRRKAEERATNLAKAAAAIPVPSAPPQKTECSERDSWLRDELNLLLWR